jgi:hypothetical protein
MPQTEELTLHQQLLQHIESQVTTVKPVTAEELARGNDRLRSELERVNRVLDQLEPTRRAHIRIVLMRELGIVAYMVTLIAAYAATEDLREEAMAVGSMDVLDDAIARFDALVGGKPSRR